MRCVPREARHSRGRAAGRTVRLAAKPATPGVFCSIVCSAAPPHRLRRLVRVAALPARSPLPPGRLAVFPFGRFLRFAGGIGVPWRRVLSWALFDPYQYDGWCPATRGPPDERAACAEERLVARDGRPDRAVGNAIPGAVAEPAHTRGGRGRRVGTPCAAPQQTDRKVP